jgi:hypothetical protein
MPKDKKEEELKIIDKRRFRLKENGTVEERKEGEEEKKKEVPQEVKKEEKEKKEFDEEENVIELPPVDFKTFIASLATTVLVNLGHIPEPSTGEPLKNLEVARYHIDIIDMLAEKTRGNLTPEEEEFLKEILRDLKLRYIEEVKSSN